MARKSAQPAPASDESNTPVTGVDAAVPAAESSVGASDGDASTDVSAGADAGVADVAQPDVDGATGGDSPGVSLRQTVPALVLHDSIYGKCGEVRDFDAEVVGALKDAGYIDPHPNAVDSAGE